MVDKIPIPVDQPSQGIEGLMQFGTTSKHLREKIDVTDPTDHVNLSEGHQAKQILIGEACEGSICMTFIFLARGAFRPTYRS